MSNIDFNQFSTNSLLDEVINREVVHIRIQKRSGRKHVTTITGLGQDLDFVRLLKAFKKNFQCIGSLDIQNEDFVLAMRLSGDQRNNVKDFLLQEQIILNENDIIIHG